MSIEVAIAELGDRLAAYPWGYLVTVSDDLRAHSLAVRTRWVDDALHANAGRGTRANIAARPRVTMVFPHPRPGEHSLIVDGDATSDDSGAVVFTPTSAVLHRPAQ